MILGSVNTKKIKKKRFIENFIVIVIIMWVCEKYLEQNEHDVTVFRVSDWIQWAELSKISDMMSGFSTIESPLSVFCCSLSVVINN